MLLLSAALLEAAASPPAAGTMTTQLAKLAREYGRLAVGVHAVNSTVFFGAAVAAVHHGCDLAPVLEWLQTDTASAESSGAKAASELAAGFVLYKAAAPVRWPLCWESTPASGDPGGYPASCCCMSAGAEGCFYPLPPDSPAPR
jgi:hypothetical protein